MKTAEQPAAVCDVCGGDVMPWELVHVIDGFVVCPECFLDFAFGYFEDDLVTGSEARELLRPDE